MDSCNVVKLGSQLVIATNPSLLPSILLIKVMMFGTFCVTTNSYPPQGAETTVATSIATNISTCLPTQTSFLTTHWMTSPWRYSHFFLIFSSSKDVPTTIDYILNYTEAKTLSYIGFSQGSCLGFAAFSAKPELSKKVRNNNFHSS
jgi:hypothetical protein